MITDGNENGTQQSYHDSVLIEFYLIQFYYSSKNVKLRQDGNSS